MGALAFIREKTDQVYAQVGRVIVGQQEVLQSMLVAV